jgi:hydroxyacylglutathione hydrolase
MKKHVLQSNVSDNFFYAIEHDGAVALVDPVDGRQAVSWVRQNEVEPAYLINTHFHRDHIGGNPTVLEAFGDIDWVVAEGDYDRIEGQVPERDVDRSLAGGDTLDVNGGELEVYETPGHTPGHISLLGADWLFSGDTIFVGGAGNCNFGGDVGTLFRTFRDVLPEFDDEVTFLPGHDYAQRDLEFILSLEPDNRRAESLLEKAEACAEDDIVLTTLGEERAYSPFFRYEEAELQSLLRREYAGTWDRCARSSESDDETAFRVVRSLRDDW